MAKITSFMRVTKQPKAHGKKVDASPLVKKEHALKNVVVVKKEKEEELSEDETGVHIPTFIYEVAHIIAALKIKIKAKIMCVVIFYLWSAVDGQVQTQTPEARGVPGAQRRYPVHQGRRGLTCGIFDDHF